MSTVAVAPEWAGVVAVICVLLFTVYELAAAPPKLTAVAGLNPLPVITTEVPPLLGPDVGATPVTAGTASYVYWSALPVADVPPRAATVMSTVPADSAGAVAVIDVPLFTV